MRESEDEGGRRKREIDKKIDKEIRQVMNAAEKSDR